MRPNTEQAAPTARENVLLISYKQSTPNGVKSDGLDIANAVSDFGITISKGKKYLPEQL
jgi:hypothetical protein